MPEASIIMIKTEFKFDNPMEGPRGTGGRFFSGPMVTDSEMFDLRQMEKLGNFAIATIKARLKMSIGADGQKMKPLKKAGAQRGSDGKVIRFYGYYANQKQKRGLQPFRDLTGFGKDGHMLDNLTVRQVSKNSVKMALTSRKARIKGLANERINPWLGFAPQDQALIAAYAGKLFKSEVMGRATNARAVLRRFRGAKVA